MDKAHTRKILLQEAVFAGAGFVCRELLSVSAHRGARARVREIGNFLDSPEQMGLYLAGGCRTDR